MRVVLAHAGRQRLRAQRHRSPADHDEAFLPERLCDQLAGEVALARLPRQEDHADRGRERPRLGDALLGEPRFEHAPGDRREDAGAVRGFAVGADPAAMLHRGQRPEGELDHLTAGLARDPRHQADAAGAVVAPGAAHRVRTPGVGARRRVHHGTREVSATGPVDRGTREVHRIGLIQVVLPGGNAEDIVDESEALRDLNPATGPVRISDVHTAPPAAINPIGLKG